MTLNPRTVWKAIPGISQVHVITLSLGRLQDLITGPGPVTVIFSRLITVSAKRHKPPIYVQHAGEVTPYLANPLLVSKRRVGWTWGWVQGWGVDAQGPPPPHTWWCKVLHSHSIPLNLPEDRVPVHCQHPSHVAGQPCCLFLAPLFGKALGCQLFPCSFCSVPAWWETHTFDTQTSGQLAKPTPKKRAYLCITQVHSAIKCLHPASTGEKHPLRILPWKKGTRPPAGAAQYLNFVLECPSYISDVMTGWIHRAAAEKSTQLWKHPVSQLIQL